MAQKLSASQGTDRAVVRRLVDRGRDVNSLDINSETPFQGACHNASTTRYLVQEGADVTLRGKILSTVLLPWLVGFELSEGNDIPDLLVG